MSSAGTRRAGKPITVESCAAPGEEWDRLVESAPAGTFSHLSGWHGIMSAALGHECRYLAARDEAGALTGVLPLVHLRSRLLGSHLVSMPFLSDGGPVGEPEARVRLAGSAVALAERLGVKLLELRGREGVEAPGLSLARAKVGVHLDLPGTVEELWEKTFRAKLRSQIRRAEKEGMEVRIGPLELDSFYGVFARNMRDLGTPVHHRRLFERISARFPEETVIGAVYHRERPVAAGFGFLWRGEFEMEWASSLREANHLSPNMLLYWSFMTEVLGRGAAVFNFGRSTPGASTHRFKLQWGGRDVELPWRRWPGSKAEGASTDRSGLRAAAGVWSRLPLPITNRLGPVLARRLPWF